MAQYSNATIETKLETPTKMARTMLPRNATN
jgi:hypothetical protein